MTDIPPIPEASTPPWPATPAPIEPSEAVAREPSKPATSKISGRQVATIGAAVGIGSAAIVAALLYTKRKPGKKD